MNACICTGLDGYRYDCPIHGGPRCTCQICGSVCPIHGGHKPTTLYLNGTMLTLANLAWIADVLEREGEVHVRGGHPRPDTPVVKELGFQIIHEDHDGSRVTYIQPIEKESTTA